MGRVFLLARIEPIQVRFFIYTPFRRFRQTAQSPAIKNNSFGIPREY